MSVALWKLCLSRLEDDLSAQQFNTWIRPLHAVENPEGLTLLAPNRFVRDFVHKEYLDQISGLAENFGTGDIAVKLGIGSDQPSQSTTATGARRPGTTPSNPRGLGFEGRLNPAFSFEKHVEGKSNQLARAAAQQVGENPGRAYNPLFLYGGVGLSLIHI